MQSAVGLGQLTALQQRLERQKQIYRIYAENLHELPGITLPGFRLETGEVPLWTDAVVERRNELDQFCKNEGTLPSFLVPDSILRRLIGCRMTISQTAQK